MPLYISLHFTYLRAYAQHIVQDHLESNGDDNIKNAHNKILPTYIKLSWSCSMSCRVLQRSSELKH